MYQNVFLGKQKWMWIGLDQWLHQHRFLFNPAASSDIPALKVQANGRVAFCVDDVA
jgi:hypothetical protein